MIDVCCFQLTQSSRFLGGDITYTKVHTHTHTHTHTHCCECHDSLMSNCLAEGGSSRAHGGHFAVGSGGEETQAVESINGGSCEERLEENKETCQQGL